MTKKYVFLAFTNPTPGREQEYNQGYDEQHLADVTKTPEHRDLALYEIETDDVEKVMEDLASRVATPGVVMTDAIDMNTLNAPVLEEITDRQDAVEVRRRRGSR